MSEGKPVVALIVAGAIIVAIPIFVLGLIRVGWRVAVLPWSERRRPGDLSEDGFSGG